MPNNKVSNDSTDRQYFIAVPRIVWAMCENPHEYTLWCVIKDIAGEHGQCYLSTADLAKIAMMSTGAVSKYRRTLIEKHLLTGEIKRDPGYPQAVWHLSIPDLWPRNVSWAMKHKSLNDRLSFKKSLHLMKPSPNEGKPSPSETKKIHIKEDLKFEEEEALAKLSKLYTNNLGMITPVSQEWLKDAVDEYPSDWFEPALKEMLKNNVRTWNYWEAILKRWKRDGFQSDSRPKKKGSASGKEARMKVYEEFIAQQEESGT